MNLKQLEAFQAIMTTGSTIGAATRMGLSQSAVSRLLTQLEDHLGLALFLRRKGRLMATPEAEELLGQVAELVDNLQRVQRMADELRLGHSRRSLLKVAVPTSMSQHLLPRIVAEFMQGREDVVVEVITGGYDALERAVLDKSADFACVCLRNFSILKCYRYWRPKGCASCTKAIHWRSYRRSVSKHCGMNPSCFWGGKGAFDLNSTCVSERLKLPLKFA